MNEPSIKHLDSGYALIWYSKECFAQIPMGWEGKIPDEYIFNPAWNRERINEGRRNLNE